MSKITHLSPEWQSWILENLGRGCTPQSVVEVMVEKNFDPMFASAIVFHFVSSGNSGAGGLPGPAIPGAQSAQQRAIQSGYVYETPRFPQAGSVIRTGDRDVRVVVRMEKPVVAVLDGLLSQEECDELIRLSANKLKRSTIVDPQTGREEVIDDRTSLGTFFSLRENEFIARLDERVSQLMHWPVENGEGLQILNYRVGGEYKPHYDYFPEQDPGSHVHLKSGGQRVSTLVMYLNDVDEGGETIFPEMGLSVSPKKGSAVYFEYCNSQGQVDPLTLHGGAPVIKGEKWIATKWMRQRIFG
ncbi:2OG-Fe(II) oxygenase [Chitiniphilus purpureus]|uniref:2OG-Fe(II) oxygenase n=1 Tax=Chitiniphilus purpureus TaxID=2981137 RepID=A0ABY6DMM5_9NEIS|nr:2OG-Fe(II) oxygenase [Chitiniphilus sp. CD1]UXY14741.1 2OG-Fe(II) oxygenase [Chitiniphilus sp. CD1]